MSDPTPNPRWKRVTNPVTPTVVTFPGGDSAAAKPFKRLTNPVTRSVITFPKPPILFVTIKRDPGADTTALPLIAARVLHELSNLEKAHGGHGLHYDADGSREEPTKLVLRLFPKLIDQHAADRVKKAVEEFNRLVGQVKEEAVRGEADLRSRIAREVSDNPQPSAALLRVETISVA